MTTITAPAASAVFASYPTQGRGRVELTDRGPGNEWRYRSHCTGCPFEDGYSSLEVAHRHARKHANKCYETPRLEGPVNEFAEALETVSPTAPMTPLAVRVGLAAAAGRPVTEREIDELPTIPEGATRADYARLLHQS
ncbi:hypothetical protein AB0900_30910 [Streptomyces cellulosae]|jgi:hypothetical protein